jgi:hypothetical protein
MAAIYCHTYYTCEWSVTLFVDIIEEDVRLYSLRTIFHE